MQTGAKGSRFGVVATRPGTAIVRRCERSANGHGTDASCSGVRSLRRRNGRSTKRSRHSLRSADTSVSMRHPETHERPISAAPCEPGNSRSPQKNSTARNVFAAGVRTCVSQVGAARAPVQQVFNPSQPVVSGAYAPVGIIVGSAPSRDARYTQSSPFTVPPPVKKELRRS